MLGFVCVCVCVCVLMNFYVFRSLNVYSEFKFLCCQLGELFWLTNCIYIFFSVFVYLLFTIYSLIYHIVELINR